MSRENRSQDRYKRRVRIMKEETITTNFHIMTGAIAAVVGLSLTAGLYCGLKVFNLLIPTYIYLAIFLGLSTAHYMKDLAKQHQKIKKTVLQWQQDEDCEIV